MKRPRKVRTRSPEERELRRRIRRCETLILTYGGIDRAWSQRMIERELEAIVELRAIVRSQGGAD